jgi:hypothetical protein
MTEKSAEMSEFLDPGSGHSKDFGTRHGDQREHLPAGDDQFFVAGPDDSKTAPKAASLHLFQDTAHLELVSKNGRRAIVDLGPDDDGKFFSQRHLVQAHPHLFSEVGSRGFDEAQVGDIVHHGGAISVEKHHVDGCGNGGSLRWLAHGG